MKYSTGYLKDTPDERDYTDETPIIKSILKTNTTVGAMPSKVSLRNYCSPIQNQGSLGSCTAQAGVSMMELYHNKNYGKYIDLSRLFLYKITRNLMNVKGDTGAYLRTTMGAMATFGVCPEEYMPYDISKFDEEPSQFCYELARHYKSTLYYRLDKGVSTYNLLNKIKNQINRGLSTFFGFSVYESIKYAGDGNIKLPNSQEKLLGGHAVQAIGYDDSKRIYNANGTVSVGAIEIENSWDRSWGDNGFGWISYDYIVKGMTNDWWVLIKNDWLDMSQFKG